MEIKDYLIARELDVAAAVYIRGELDQREADKETRFWRNMFGADAVDDGDNDDGPTITVRERSDDGDDVDILARTALGRSSASWQTTQAQAN